MRTVRVYNVTRRRDLATQCRVAETFWSRLKGLIGRRTLAPGEGLLIRPSRGVHMWFMRFPIDVLYVDREGRVVDVDEHLRPWRIGRPRLRAHFVVELPAGTVAATGTQPGDRIVIHEAGPQKE